MNLLLGEQMSPFESSPFEMRGKYKNGRVASPESILLRL